MQYVGNHKNSKRLLWYATFGHSANFSLLCLSVKIIFDQAVLCPLACCAQGELPTPFLHHWRAITTKLETVTNVNDTVAVQSLQSITTEYWKKWKRLQLNMITNYVIYYSESRFSTKSVNELAKDWKELQA